MQTVCRECRALCLPEECGKGWSAVNPLWARVTRYKFNHRRDRATKETRAVYKYICIYIYVWEYRGPLTLSEATTPSIHFSLSLAWMKISAHTLLKILLLANKITTLRHRVIRHHCGGIVAITLDARRARIFLRRFDFSRAKFLQPQWSRAAARRRNEY